MKHSVIIKRWGFSANFHKPEVSFGITTSIISTTIICRIALIFGSIWILRKGE